MKVGEGKMGINYTMFIKEDSPQGDITSQAIFGRNPCQSEAHIVAKEDLVVSGFVAVKGVLKNFKKLKLKILKDDGQYVKKGTALAKIAGPVTDLLLVERTVLNFLQRMSGIATLTQRYVHRVHGACPEHGRRVHLSILDTRKTTPGLRALEKKAVRDGGGKNHRMNLSDQYLIKDNHIDAAGSVANAMIAALEHRRRSKQKRLIEIEVRTPEEFIEALMFMPDIILLDNMKPAMIRKLVNLRNRLCAKGKKVLLEISGGVSLQNMKKYLRIGVERISIGALTHSARAVDISMKLTIKN